MSPQADIHAPFPWTIASGAIHAADGSTVCTITNNATLSPRQAANARMIAACEAMQKALALVEAELAHHRLADSKIQQKVLVAVHGAITASR